MAWVGVGGGCVMIELQVGVVELQNHGGLVVLRWEGNGGDGWYLGEFDWY